MNRKTETLKRSLLLILLLLLVLNAPCAQAGPYLNEALSSTPVQIKAGAASVYHIRVVNRDATNPIYLHFYDALAANVTLGTTAQTDFVAVPAGGAYDPPQPGGAQMSFGTGLTVAITTSPLYTGTTAPGTAAVVSIAYQ